MPCYYVATVKVEDEAIGRRALDALGLNQSRLRQRGSLWALETADRSEESAFRTEYAKQFSLEQARRNMYSLRQEDDDGETLTLRFTR